MLLIYKSTLIIIKNSFVIITAEIPEEISDLIFEYYVGLLNYSTFDSTFGFSGLLPTWPVNSASISLKHCQQCQGQSQMGDVIDTLPEITIALQRREVTEENNGVVNSWQRVERRH